MSLRDRLDQHLGARLGLPYYQLRTRYKLHRGRARPPVLVWQMGKAGSKSIQAAIQQACPGSAVFHVHALGERLLADGEMRRRSERRGNRAHLLNLAIRERLLADLAAGRPWRVISVVREPVARNLSAFFQNLDLYAPDLLAGGLDRPGVTAALLERFRRDFDHDRPLHWMDIEIRAVTGIDVYQTPFDQQAHQCRIRQGALDLLLLRLDDLDRAGNQVLGDFFQRPVQLDTHNAADSKGYAAAYRAFCAAFRPDPDYLARLYDARYTRHFYTPAEISALRRRWAGG